ncbi:MAG: hypothetical protein R2864_12065 [Syntrophotaleaceae bacterium]
MKSYKTIDFSAVKRYSIKTRDNKVNVKEHFAQPPKPGRSVADFLDSLPHLLGADNLRGVVDAVVAARQKGKPVVLAMGGHVIKCGLQPVLKALIEADVITAVVMNGSVTIHDFEVSLVGLPPRMWPQCWRPAIFGFSEETGIGMNLALKQGREQGLGYGEAIGRCIVDNDHPFREYSLLATCVDKGISVTVHVAIGTDIIHQHPEADGAVIGEMSYRDFKLLTSVVSELGDGGVWLNVGSAVLPPEVFLQVAIHRPEPRLPCGRLHHRQFRHDSALPPHDQCSQAADPRPWARLYHHRPPRDQYPPLRPGGSGSDSMRREAEILA